MLDVATAMAKAQGIHEQYSAQKNMLQYQAQAATLQQQNVKNAAQANITAVQDQASRNATMLGRNQSELKGKQVANAGAQGIGSSGTAADIAKDTFTKQQMDQMTLQYNANVKAWDITNRANNQIWNLGIENQQDTIGARNVSRAGKIAVYGSYLDSAMQTGNNAVQAYAGFA